MKINSTKTLLLILLIIGVLLQTTQLWFENYSSHNFFYSFVSRKNRFADESYKIEPASVLVNINGMNFVAADNGDMNIKAVSEGLISKLLRDGKYTETVTLDWSALLELKAVVCEYPVPILTEAFAKSFNERANELCSRVVAFDTIVITPSRTSGDTAKFYIVDRSQKNAYVYELRKGASDLASKEIDKLVQLAGNEPYFISSEQNRLDFFNSNVFLPQWKESSYTFLLADTENPIEKANNLESCVDLFFDNPVGVINAVDANGVPFFSNENTVVKYYADTELLEYINYSQGGDAYTPFNEAYTTALNFFKRDATLLNDVYLTDAVSEDGVWTLYFDYRLNGMTAFLPDTDNKTRHAIEIKVEASKVAKYSRIVKNIRLSEEKSQLRESFLIVLDRLLAESKIVSEGGKLDDMQIGYLIAQNGMNEVKWFAKASSSWYCNI